MKDTLDKSPAHYRKQDILERYKIGQTTLGRWLRDGEFPQPIKIGKTSYWPAKALAEFDEILVSRARMHNRQFRDPRGRKSAITKKREELKKELLEAESAES